MPRYRYTGFDSIGRRVTGERDATDPDALLSEISGEVRQVESVQRITSVDRSGTSQATGIHGSDVTEISSHIAEIMEAQLPLESGLAAIAAECPSSRLRRSLEGISRDLASGRDLSTVLADRGAPAELRALVIAGARSDNTAQILEHYVLNTQSVVDLKQLIRRSLAYPLILIIAFAGVATFVLGWLVPQFALIFDGFSLKLPLMTELLLSASTWLRRYGVIALVGGVGGFFGLALLARIGLGRIGFRRLLCRLPLIGPILRWAALARFSQLLSLLVENRVPLDEALVLAGDGAGDAEIEGDCRLLQAGVNSGETLENAARQLDRFPLSFVQALSWEHRADGLPEVLQSLGDMYAGRVRAGVAVLIAVIPPIVMVVLGATASFVVIALFAPLISLINALL